MEALETSTAYQAASLDERLYEDDRGGVTLGDMLGSRTTGSNWSRTAPRHVPRCARSTTARAHMLRLRFMDNKTQSEIAAELGVSQMTSRAFCGAHSRRCARQRLRTTPCRRCAERGQPTRARARAPSAF